MLIKAQLRVTYQDGSERKSESLCFHGKSTQDNFVS